MATNPMTAKQFSRMKAWVHEMHAWQRRVRRDILAHEVFFKENFPSEWGSWSATWELSNDESADEAHAKSQRLLAILGLPPDPVIDRDQYYEELLARRPDLAPSSDPGDPPMPPLP